MVLHDRLKVLQESLLQYLSNCSHKLTAPVARLSCVIYNSAINLQVLLLTFMAASPVRETRHRQRNKASQLSQNHSTLSGFYSTGRTRKQKLYILISKNACPHPFCTEESAAELNHCQFTKTLALWYVWCV